MLPNSKSFKLRKMKKPETSRRPLLKLLKLITRLLTRLWTSIDPSWKVKLPRLNSSKRKLRDKERIIKKS